MNRYGVNRSVACPNCQSEFTTGSHKCICPACGAAFFRGSTTWCDSSRPLVPKSPPQSWDEVSDRQRKLAHWMLNGVAEFREPFGWHGFASMGLDGVAEWLIDLGYFQRIDRKYSITAVGSAKLLELTQLLGIPQYPPRGSPCDGDG